MTNPSLKIERYGDNVKIEAHVGQEYREFFVDPRQSAPRDAVLDVLRRIEEEFGIESPGDVKLPREDWLDLFPEAGRD